MTRSPAIKAGREHECLGAEDLRLSPVKTPLVKKRHLGRWADPHLSLEKMRDLGWAKDSRGPWP